MYDIYNKCEESLKKKILDNYEKYLSESQIKSINEKNYITDEILGIKRLNDLFNVITDKMFDDLLNINASKKEIIDEDTIVTIPVGKTLKNILKNYYKIAISKQITFNPIVDYKYAHDLDIIDFLNKENDSIIDKNVFNKNIIELSNIKELSDYINEIILKDINEVINSQ